MSDYSDLSTTIGKIKRAAIDAYMTHPDSYYEIDGDSYRYRGSSMDMNQRCSRPGPDGEGGGNASLDGWFDFPVNHLDAQFRSAFDSIRRQVDEIFAPLKDIPTGRGLGAVETRMMRAAGDLTPAGANIALARGGAASLELNNPTLSARVNAIHGYCYRLSSLTINAFRESYVDRLAAVLDSQAALCATLGMAAAGQRAIFKKLREDVAELADQALESLDALAHNLRHGGDGGKASIDVAGALLSIGSLGLTGGGAALLAGGGTMFGLMGALWPAPPAEKPVYFSGGDVDAMLQSIADGRDKILEGAIADEVALRSALRNASAMVSARSTAGDFDIRRPTYPSSGPGQEGLGGPGTIVQNHADMQRLAALCQLVSDIVEDAKDDVRSGNTGNDAWERPSAVGLGRTGPYSHFDGLSDDVVALLRNTSSELQQAAENLILASLDFQATDREVATTLGREMREVRQVEIASQPA